MQFQILEILAGAAFLQLTFYSLFLLNGKTENPLPNRFLAAFLFAKALCIGNLLSFLMFKDVMPITPHLFYIGSSFTVLWGPLLYLYARAITHPKFRWRAAHVAHLTPFFIHLAFMTVRYHRFDAESKRYLLQNGLVLSRGEGMAVSILIQVVILAYTAAALVLLFRYRKAIRSSMSTVERFNLSWLSTVIYGFLVKMGFDLAYYALNFIWGKQSTALLIGNMATLVVFIQILVYYSMHQPAVRFGLGSGLKYRGSPLTENQKKQTLSRIEKIMTEEPFLDPMLPFPRWRARPRIAAPRVAGPERGSSPEFFVASFRRIEGIGGFSKGRSGKNGSEHPLGVGFNSKSSFSSAFKRYAE
jgi:hypothetical protein